MNTKIRDAMGVLVVIALAAVSFGVLSYVKTYARVTEPTSFRSFTVSGEGEVVAVPDVAQFSFSLITEGGLDVAKLQSDNSESMNNAIKFLKDNDVDEKDIKTRNYNIQPRYTTIRCPRDGTPCPPSEISGYSITQSVQVKVRDFDKVGDVLSGVVKNGANSVSSLSFTIDDPTEVENEARAEAIEMAKDKAKDIAKAGGFRVGRLLSINEDGGGFPSPYPVAYGGFALEARADQAFAPEIEPGSQDVTMRVVLTYEIQ